MLKYFAAVEATELGVALPGRTSAGEDRAEKSCTDRALCWRSKALLDTYNVQLKKPTQTILLRRGKFLRMKYENFKSN